MKSVAEAIEDADAGFREGLRGQYPAAAKVLADDYVALLAAARCALASWDDENDTPIHEAMFALRAVVKPNARLTGPKRPLQEHVNGTE